MAAKKNAVLHPREPGFEAGAGFVRHAVLARLDGLDVDSDCPLERHAVVGRPAGDLGGIGACNQRLRRHAAGIYAGAAQQLAFDHGHAHPGPGEAAGERRPSLAAADHDRVETPRHATAHTIWSPAMIATASSSSALDISLP